MPYPKLEADGLTVKLVAKGVVEDSESWNSMKLVVADVGDRLLDSW